MSPCSRNRQRGDMLLEALVGVLITGLLGAGMAHVASRIVNTQHDTAVDALVVNQLRNVLQVSGVDLCSDASPLAERRGLPAQLSGLALSGACGTASTETLTIGGVSFEGTLPPRIELTATQDDRPALTVSSVVPAVADEDGQ